MFVGVNCREIIVPSMSGNTAMTIVTHNPNQNAGETMRKYMILYRSKSSFKLNVSFMPFLEEKYK